MNPRPVNDLRFSRILAGNMRRMRHERGITASALAATIEAGGHRMSEASINQLEWSRTRTPRSMTVDHLMWIAKAFDVPPASLLTDPDQA